MMGSSYGSSMGESSHWSAAVLSVVYTTVVMDFAGTLMMRSAEIVLLFSPLSVDDFIKKSQYIYYTRDALSRAQETVSHFAKKEGLTGHARSIDIRFDPAVVGEDKK